jgi:hypothetical protein
MKKHKWFTPVIFAMAITSFGYVHADQFSQCAEQHTADLEGADAALDKFEQYFPAPLVDDSQEMNCATMEETRWHRRSWGDDDSYGAGSTHAPVWPTFIRNLHSCAPGCVPVNYNAYRHQRNSCHNTGHAVDVGGISCGGHVYRAINGGRFAQMVRCMKGKMIVLYRNGPATTAGHHDHAHFSIGCSIPGHPHYW